VNSNLIFAAAFAVICVGLLLGGQLRRTSRTSWWLGAVAAAVAALCGYYDAFWAVVCFGLLAGWAFIGGLRVLDAAWRLRFGIVMIITVLAAVALWPSLETMTSGLIPCPTYIKEHVKFRLVAGLDLRGGLRLVYTVDVDEALKDRRDRHYEDMQTELSKIFELHSGDERPTEEVFAKLRDKVSMEKPAGDVRSIKLTLKNPADSAKVDSPFLQIFSPDLTFSQSADQLTYNFRLRNTVESQIRDSAVAQAKEIILRRVDELGLREAAVSTREEDIIVEVPGQDEAGFKEIRDIISQTARLEFKLLDDETDFFAPIRLSADKTSLPEGIGFQQETASIGLDPEGDVRRKTLTYAFIHRKDKETAKESLERFKAWTSTLTPPPDREFGFEQLYETDKSQKASDIGWRTYLLKSRAEITGDLIRDARAQPDTSPNGMGGWYVGIRFTDAGGATFERITGANIKRRFAIILDNRIESAPVIQSRIAGGNASITLGSSDPESQLRDARKLELVLRSGALPAPITPSNEQHIGPSLGADSIQLGVRGAIGGSLVVLMFMLLYYRRAGLIANVAVILNVFLLLAVLASFGASMTLPGIAGLALTIGMSVDSNVLINERIREELRAGKSPRAAVEVGYSKALSAIIDGQLTTLISAIVLAQFGTGPIKGFAVTLMVGIACSLFTGVTVSRVMFDVWVRGLGRTAKLDMG
jgi:preprotein translocase subunit SecD